MIKQRGLTIMEMSVVMLIMTLLLVGSASLLSSTIKNFTHTTNQIDSDMSASIALQIVNRDLQEAKQVAVLSSTRVRVYYPQVAEDGSYIRNALDEVNTVDFFRGKADGTPSASGKYLVRDPAIGSHRVICEDVTNLEFRSISPSSVDITLRTERKTDQVVRHTEMIHRAIFLRNY